MLRKVHRDVSRARRYGPLSCPCVARAAPLVRKKKRRKGQANPKQKAAKEKPRHQATSLASIQGTILFQTRVKGPQRGGKVIFPRFVNCQDGPPAAGLGALGEALEAWVGIGNLTRQSRSGCRVGGTLTVATSRARARTLERRIAVVGDRGSAKKEVG